MYELLLTLDRAKLKGGDGWVASNALRHIPQHIRSYAQQKGYTTGRGRTAARQYMITSLGRTKLANNAEANLAMMDEIENGYVPMGEEATLTIAEPTAPLKAYPGLDIEIRPGFVPSPAIVAAKKNIAINFSLIPDVRVRACVQAIAILGENFQEVNDLVNALVKINARKARDHE